MKSAPLQSAKGLRLRLRSLGPRLKLPYPSRWLRRVGSSIRLIQRRRRQRFTRRASNLFAPMNGMPEVCPPPTFAANAQCSLNNELNHATLTGILAADAVRGERMATEGMPSPGQSEHDLLEGWKAIADHLHKTERTVQRWEKTRGLPVRRFNASSPEEQSRVFAYKSELDAWWQELLAKPGEPDPPEPILVEPVPVPPPSPPTSHRSVWIWVALAASVAAVVALAFWSAPILTKDFGGGPPQKIT